MAEATAMAPGISRREFLYYIWGASIVMVTGELGYLLYLFLLPRFREGQFGGIFKKDIGALPEVNAPPVPDREGRFWLVNLDTGQPNRRMFQNPDEGPIKGVAAIYKVCTHLGCIYDWNVANDRFECPCHGSKYRLDGRRYQNPAPRTLDRFKIQAVDAAGNMLAESSIGAQGDYEPLVLPDGTAELWIDTGARKQGPSPVLLGLEPAARPATESVGG